MEYNKHIIEDLIRLRDEIEPRAFNSKGICHNSDLAEIYFKINSCLFKGYPKRPTMVKFYTRTALCDEWTERNVDLEELASDVQYYVEMGYYIKIDRQGLE